jgi:phosphinothricin acetyltransferase
MLPDGVLIRASTDTDIAAITEIYGHHVLDGAGSFEIDPPGSLEMGRRRLEIVNRGLPYLVAEHDGRVVGYAYAGLYRPRPAYRFTLEDSVYVHPGFVHRGIAAALLDQLIVDCREWGARQLVAVIGDSANLASIRLHEKLGFEHVGVLRAVGFKFDRWLDTVLMQRSL